MYVVARLLDKHSTEEIMSHYRKLGNDLNVVTSMINRCKVKADLKLNYQKNPQGPYEVEKSQYIRVWKKADGIEQAFKRG